MVRCCIRDPDRLVGRKQLNSEQSAESNAGYKEQISFFQSYLKKGMLAGIHAAQTWRKEEEMPKVLLPISSRVGTISPMIGPATYHGQGWERNCMSLVKGNPGLPGSGRLNHGLWLDYFTGWSFD